MKKSWQLFVLKEWLLLPVSIWQALTCDKPHYVYYLMEDAPEQNKIIPYKIIMTILKYRAS